MNVLKKIRLTSPSEGESATPPAPARPEKGQQPQSKPLRTAQPPGSPPQRPTPTPEARSTPAPPRSQPPPQTESRLTPPPQPKVQPQDQPVQSRAASKPQPGKPVGNFGGRPGLLRTLWAMHPSRTTRRLRRLLLSWEKLGYFMSFSGDAQEPTPETERAFLKAKTSLARSVSFLRFIEGTGNIGREVAQKEAEFMELLERFPSLQSTRKTSEAARKELYYSWHSLYLFIHRILGANPYETENPSAAYKHTHFGRSDSDSGRLASAGGRRMQ